MDSIDLAHWGSRQPATLVGPNQRVPPSWRRVEGRDQYLPFSGG